jgi:hypothetical protein
MTSITSQARAIRDLTVCVNNSTAATGFVVAQPPSGIYANAFIVLEGFSLVPIANGTMTFTSGNTGDTDDDEVIWKTSVVSGQRIDFTGPFVNCEQNKALKLTTTAALGEMTIKAGYR